MFFLKKKFAEYKVLFGTSRLKLDVSIRSIVQLCGSTWSVWRIKGSVKFLDSSALTSILNLNAQCERDRIRTCLNMTSNIPTHDKYVMIIHIYTIILKWSYLKSLGTILLVPRTKAAQPNFYTTRLDSETWSLGQDLYLGPPGYESRVPTTPPRGLNRIIPSCHNRLMSN
jgi:hypothetical protein